ncbi:AAA family ATPase [Candidatus Woesearchaeota archaeon]|nr:AAA family ATPase [Candidatus Woesearchaeota archaeon]
MLYQQLKTILIGKEPFGDILGQEEVKSSLKSALLMGRHVIIVGMPGVGKTTLAKNVAKLLPEIEVVKGCPYHCDPKDPICPQCRSRKSLSAEKIRGEQRFVRIQGSPDLTVEDLIGDIDPVKAIQYGALSLEAFTPGKIFKANRGILFFDEINRCPEKLQNAMLQVLEERKATIGSYSVDLTADFIFIGTMNPEDTSTEKLSDVFLDRFDLIHMSYPETADLEKQIVLSKGKKMTAFPDALLTMAIHFVRLLRESDKLSKKPGVRGTIGLYERSQSHAYLNQRKNVTFEDLKAVVVSVLAHRIALKPSVKFLQKPEEFIEEQFKQISEMYEEQADRGESL